MSDSTARSDVPLAALRPQRRVSWLWLVPLLAAILAGWIGYRSWLNRGLVITVLLDEGHGLEPGARVVYSGITIGEIREIYLHRDLDGIAVEAALLSRASDLARGGSRFWVVRPQVGLSGVAGLETVVGPRYLAMLPGDGPPQRRFVGLSEPPVIESVDPGDLEIVLQTARRKGLRPGAPVLYRQVPVGTVLSVGLTSDGGSVEARVHIQKAFTELVREQTRFWNAGGLHAQLGLRGMTIEAESLDTLLAGGVALATPPDGGAVVRDGHRFAVEDKPEDEWLAWEPMVDIGNPLLPAGAPLPSPLRAVKTWRQGMLNSEKTRRGWVLQTEFGLLGPADLLMPSESESESLVIEINGRPLPAASPIRLIANGLALTDFEMSRKHWPASRCRVPETPEDCLAVADPAAPSLPLAASRLTPKDESWIVDHAIAIDPGWHGAVVVSRKDGKVIGIVLVDDDTRVALVPELTSRTLGKNDQ